MTIKLELKFDQRFAKRLQGRYDRFDFQVGVLENKAYKAPRPKSAGHGSMEGGPVRKKSYRTRGTVADVSEAVRKRVDFYRIPVRKKKSREIRKFLDAFGALASGVTKGYGSVEAALRAVIRLPILRGDYGKNAASTVKAKGFNRFMIDTGQLYRAIVAKVRVKRVQS